MGFSRPRNKHSLSEAISVSLGLQSQPGSEFDTLSVPRGNPFSNGTDGSPHYYLGRSYVANLSPPPLAIKERFSGDLTPSSRPEQSQSIHQSVSLRRQTAALSNEFDGTFEFEDQLEDLAENDNAGVEDEPVMAGSAISPTSSGPEPSVLDTPDASNLLLPSNAQRDLEYGSIDEFDHQYVSLQSQRTGSNSRAIDPNASTRDKMLFSFRRLGNYVPAVILGLLLNILDALSYGMIIFPITEPLFSHLGPSGLSMFYVSSIVSQLVYSCGFSAFGNAVGSEMIEITPFYHSMAASIMAGLPGEKDRVLTTTIVCYAMSSIMTGLVFFLLGRLKLGKIVGFFPRHILIGCIGGVGYFLVITGFEVTTRVSKFEYSFDFLSSLLMDPEVLGKWGLPALMAVLLVVIQRACKNSLVLPTFYIAALLLFHFIVALIPSLSLHGLRDSGWVFPATTTTERWFDFYKLYNFKLVSWPLVLKQVPTMLALTFFGILHVPINVPALAMSIGLDKLDVDKELIAHGYSNFLSGLIGSVQNYLVYTNSLLFIKAGADDSLAGLMLAAATFGIMVVGPVIVAYIPVCIVGSLIFLLGYELIKEALVDTWGKLNSFEYATVVAIVFTMGAFDFVLGIIVGILIACFSFLVDSTKLQTINGEFDGQVARSTVRRDYIQTQFLNKIGEQIHVLKLQNLLFFGTIISIEEKIDRLLELSDKDSSKKRIKYLILDFKNINADNIDYSAAEGFNRIKRFTFSKRIHLIISSIKTTDRIYRAFNKVGTLDGVELFDDLNSALEWCENEFLRQFKDLRNKTKLKAVKKQERQLSKGALPFNTPRNNHFVSVAQKLFTDEQSMPHLKTHYKEKTPVLHLLLSALQRFRPGIMSPEKPVKETEEKLWSELGKYFFKRRLAAQSLLPHKNNIFLVVESGMVKVTYNLRQGQLYEILCGKTCYGRITVPNSSEDPISSVEIKMETDCALWILDETNLVKLKRENLALYTELLLVTLCMNQDRLKELLGHCLVSS
ncbi:LAQU0S04e02740g1_1 [Lachancea quebecensis]|uniref:LAQU0S04e02740g1_1 n=1 Tax=Lachancea quebecensis TaxID=1654605 RepID=A0A0P1KQG1_9SACH|nr:LAQU0S04e02740g1_1 [Lachancea quebecensis]